MIVPTSEIQSFLGNEGYKRDNVALFTYVGYQGKENDLIIFLDEEWSLQDTDHLIEDWEGRGASDLVNKLRKWVTTYKPH